MGQIYSESNVTSYLKRVIQFAKTLLLPQGKWQLRAVAYVTLLSKFTFQIHLMQVIYVTFDTLSLLLWTLDTTNPLAWLPRWVQLFETNWEPPETFEIQRMQGS